jgi:hypothetical protein
MSYMAQGVQPRRSSLSQEQSILLDTPVLVGELVALLGANLVAYLGGVRETRTLRGWAEGTGTVQSPTDERRLQLAYQIGRLIGEKDSRGVVQAWFQGLNPQLDDWSPARLLREGDIDEVGPRVLAAARAFAASG